MAQQKQDYGAAQGLMDDYGKVVGFLSGKPKEKPVQKTDSYKADPKDVEKANESFRKADADRRGTAMKSSATVSGSKPKAKKNRKSAPSKRY